MAVPLCKDLSRTLDAEHEPEIIADAIHEIRRLLQASLKKTEEIRRLSEKTEAELRDLGVIVQTISEKMDINEERMQKIRNDIQLNGDRLTMLQTQKLAQASSAVKYGPEPREPATTDYLGFSVFW